MEIEEMSHQQLKDEVIRLRKAVHNMYVDFKSLSLKFLLEADLTTEDKKLFKECFSNYLK